MVFKTWKRGDKLKIADLNRFEEGIASKANNENEDEIITIEKTIGEVQLEHDVYTATLEDDNFIKITSNSEVTVNGNALVNVVDAGKPTFALNLDSETGDLIGTPAIYFEIDGTTLTYGTDVNPSNSLLTIIVKNKKSSNNSNNEYLVTGTLVGGDNNALTVSDLSANTEDIYAAFLAGKRVHLKLNGEALATNMHIDLPLTQVMGDDVAIFGGVLSGSGTTPGLVLVWIDEHESEPVVTLMVPQAATE